MRNARRIALLAMCSAALLGAAACSQIQGDIDRVGITPYWEKSDFENGASWYYQTTVVDAAPNSWLFPGDGGYIVMERLKWEVTETQLIGWRDYAGAAGTEDDSLAGGEDTFKGAPIAIFAVSDHFDIRRTYDPLTGEESNEIVENRERPWYQRRYFRVDWSRNLVPSFNFHFEYQQIADTWVVQPNDIGDPKRWRFDRDENDQLDYFEVTTRSSLYPNLNAAFGLYGPGHVFDFAPALTDIRHSFMKVKESDYIPLPYPASVVRVDEMGQEIRDENGYAERVPIFDRFGYFTTWDRQVWDPERGFTKPSEENLAIRYNIWEKNRDSMGNELPLHERTPKPIIFYTNQQHPKQLLHAAERVATEWNLVYKDMIFEAQNLSAQEAGQPAVYASRDEVPDMFILRENDCNPTNVQDYLNNVASAVIRDQVALTAADYNFSGRIEDVVQRYEFANSLDNEDSFTARQNLETQALNDLERICSALEHYTSKGVAPAEFSGTPFTYQRVGDIRYNMLNAIVEKALVGWLGVANITADPVTGEEIYGVANIGIAAVDQSAYYANEAVRALNGELDLDDVLYGYDIEGYIQDKLARSKLLMSYQVGNGARERMNNRFLEMGKGRESMVEVSPDYQKSRLNRLADTVIEDKVLSDETLMAYGQVDPATLAAFDGDLEAATLDRASPFRNWEENGPQSQERYFNMLGERGIDPVEFLDSFSIGAAMLYRHIESDRERFEKIREDLYVSTQLHEVGHTLALRHNFEASTDALNYGRSFWEIQQLDPDLDVALGQTTGAWAETIQACIDFQAQLRQQEGDSNIEINTQQCLAQNQQMYSTIMEYNGHWTADFGGCLEGCGLGMYDYQAIKFGYAKMLQVFDNPTTTRTEAETKRWLFLNDWRDITSDIVPSVEALTDRSYVFYDWNQYSTSKELPDNLVPYRFCTDGYYTPTCIRWDWGPDNKYNASYQDYAYWQRYFFTHFSRGRFWPIWGNGGWRNAFFADYRTMDDYTQKMKWYYYYKTVDPEFSGSYAEDDYLATTIQGLNHIMHVLGHPGSGDFITVPRGWADHSTDISPYDYTTDADRLAPGDIMRSWDYLGQCDVYYLNDYPNGIDANTNRPTAARAGFNLATVPLGDGRPFAIGSERSDSEEWLITYVGTYFSKELALGLLGDGMASFPRTDYFGTDLRNYYISWYRLFPEEVGSIIRNFIVENYADLGPVVDADGNVHQRDLIDPVTGETPDYTGYSRITPSISFNHQYYSAIYALALMSFHEDGAYDMEKSFLVAVEGAEDDFGLFDQLAGDPDLVEFEHPISGRRIRAVDRGPQKIGADLVRRVNLLKERWEVLNGCMEGDLDPASTPYCKCSETIRAQTSVNGQGEEVIQLFCEDPYLETPGEGICGEYELRNRRDRAREVMDDMQDFIDDVRILKKIFEI